MKAIGFAVAAAAMMFAAGQAQAMPMSPAVDFGGDANLIQVRDGCGFGAHQGPAGGCRLNRGWRGHMRGSMGGAPRGCPPGTHPTGRGFCARNYR